MSCKIVQNSSHPRENSGLMDSCACLLASCSAVSAFKSSVCINFHECKCLLDALSVLGVRVFKLCLHVVYTRVVWQCHDRNSCTRFEFAIIVCAAGMGAITYVCFIHGLQEMHT